MLFSILSRLTVEISLLLSLEVVMMENIITLDQVFVFMVMVP